jgi:asparaginyl-tRNA synthetase
MNTFTPISTLKDCIGQEVTLAGWVYKNRPTGKLIFLTVRDGTGLCQCIIEKGEATADFFADAKHLAQESSVTVRGTVRGDERAVGGCELVVSGIELVHAARDYPITPKAHGVEFLMKHRHLWFRSRRQFLILRIRATVVDAIRSYFNRNGYVLIDTPLFAPSAGEGESTLFEVDYFGEPVSLAQTGQLYVESACMAHGKVYCFGPTFRAEKSKTRRHLTEFWMVEPEIAFADLDEVIAMAEDFVCDVVGRVLRDHRADLEELGRDLAALDRIQKPFYRLHYLKAAELLRGPQARDLLAGELAEKEARIAELERDHSRAGGAGQIRCQAMAERQSRPTSHRCPRGTDRSAGAGPQHPPSHGTRRQFRGGQRSGRIGRDDHLPPARQAGVRHPLSARGQGLLHAAGS